MASLFVVVVFAGGVPVWEVLDAGGPPQPYYADYVIGQIDLGEQVVVRIYEFPRAYQGVSIRNGKGFGIGENGEYKLALHPEDRRLAGRSAIIYLSNDMVD
ncbi:MAG: hypothetical protein CM1200mP15_17510 [Dehalococcoidia bacterium]|nr:MAG: hypothetical protein CM1200mP15_17510 [Dehalococcoidia bacterium]